MSLVTPMSHICMIKAYHDTGLLSKFNAATTLL